MNKRQAFGWFILGYTTANLLAAGIDALANWYDKKEAEQATAEKIETNGKYGNGVWRGDAVSAYPKDLTDTIRENMKRSSVISSMAAAEMLLDEVPEPYPTREDIHPLEDRQAELDAQRDAEKG